MTGQTTDAGIISLGAVQGFSFEVRPAIASGSETATAMVSLVAVAPAGGAVVTITSDRSSVVVPASVTVPGGTRVLTFPVTYARVASSTWVTISATNAGITNQAHVMLTPGPTVVSISQPAKWPYVGRVDSIFGPADLESTVALSEPAPGGGLQVSLTSSNTPMISVPATILVPAGALLVTFPVHAAAVATTTISTITASLPSGSASALLTDTSAVGLSSISVPPYGRTGKSIQIRVVLNMENANGTCRQPHQLESDRGTSPGHGGADWISPPPGCHVGDAGSGLGLARRHHGESCRYIAVDDDHGLEHQHSRRGFVQRRFSLLWHH